MNTRVACKRGGPRTPVTALQWSTAMPLFQFTTQEQKPLSYLKEYSHILLTFLSFIFVFSFLFPEKLSCSKEAQHLSPVPCILYHIFTKCALKAGQHCTLCITILHMGGLKHIVILKNLTRNKKVWGRIIHLGNKSPQSLSVTVKYRTRLSVPLRSSHRWSTR